MHCFSNFVRNYPFSSDTTKAKPKCAQYWPDIGSQSHGHMQVKTLGEHRMVGTDDEIVHDIIERDLEVCNQTAGKYFSYLIFGNKEFKGH